MALWRVHCARQKTKSRVNRCCVGTITAGPLGCLSWKDWADGLHTPSPTHSLGVKGTAQVDFHKRLAVYVVIDIGWRTWHGLIREKGVLPCGGDDVLCLIDCMYPLGFGMMRQKIRLHIRFYRLGLTPLASFHVPLMLASCLPCELGPRLRQVHEVPVALYSVNSNVSAVETLLYRGYQHGHNCCRQDILTTSHRLHA